MEVVEKIKNAKNIAIFAHKNPDPDAYGSAFAMREMCRNLGKNADVFSDAKSDYLHKIFPLNELRTDFKAESFDLVIVCDLHANSRFDKIFLPELLKAKNVMIIDHHEDAGEERLPQAEMLTLPEKSATCEILFDIFSDAKLKVDPTTATYLWAGLVGDTGRFLHSNLTEHVLDVARKLVLCGAKVQFVYDAMFRSVSREENRLNMEFLKRIVYVSNGQGAYAIFNRQDMENAGVDEEKYKAFSGDMVKIEGVLASILCLETEKNHFKFSVRSNGVDCSKVCASMGGGGHKNASGFELDITEKEVRSQISHWIELMLADKM